MGGCGGCRCLSVRASGVCAIELGSGLSRYRADSGAGFVGAAGLSWRQWSLTWVRPRAWRRCFNRDHLLRLGCCDEGVVLVRLIRSVGVINSEGAPAAVAVGGCWR